MVFITEIIHKSNLSLFSLANVMIFWGECNVGGVNVE